MTTINSVKQSIEIFYDGHCGLCRREIAYYQRIAPHHLFRFTDVTQEAERLLRYGLSLEAALKKFYVADADEKLQNGVDAFIVIWQQLRGWRWLARLVNLRLLKPCVALLYQYFTAWRYRRNGYDHCSF